jgi:transcriptional regulator with XRE-family HTH domain
MLKYKDLIKTPEYRLETIQNEIFRQVWAYMEKEDLNQSQLAKRLGVSKGYISQIINGNFNFTLKKLIELATFIGVVPEITFKSLDDIAKENEQAKVIPIDYHVISTQSGTGNFRKISKKTESVTVMDDLAS